MREKPVSSLDDMYRFCAQFGLTPEEVDHYIDEYRRLGLLREWIDEDGFYHFTANEDVPLEQALMIISCCVD